MVLQRLLLVAALLLALCLTACGADEKEKKHTENDSTQEQPEPSPKPAEHPVHGGRLVLGVIGDASNLIPQLSTDNSSHKIAKFLYVAPLKYDKDLNITTWAAEKYDVEDDGKLLRFYLKKGILWDDGIELTAEDVEFTYKFMIDPKTPTAYSEDYRAIQEFTLIDKYTFEVRYEKPFARALITWMHDILPKHALEGQDPMKTELARKPLSAGPYRLKEWVSGEKIVLEARDGYFAGRPYLDQIVFRIIPDYSTMFLDLKAGNLDMMTLTPQQYTLQTKGEKWEKEFLKFKYLSFSYMFLGYNMKSPLFQDQLVRQALAHAINKEEIIKGVYLGLAAPTIGPFKPGTWVFNDNIKDNEYNPAKAKALLAQAGWEDTDDDGLLDKDGAPFSFEIMTNQGNTMRAKTATIIQERLKDIGIEVKVRIVEWAAFIKEFVDTGKFDSLILGWNILHDPDIFDVWHSSKAVKGSLNFIKYNNKEVDALLEQGRSVMNQRERKIIYDKLQEILHAEQPYCFLVVPYALPIVHSRFQGIEPAPIGIDHNISQWWVPKKLQKFSQEQQ